MNQTVFEDEILDIATSLKLEFERDFDKEEILVKFLNEFEKEYLDMIN